MSFTMFLLDLKINGQALNFQDTRNFADVLRQVLREEGYSADYMPAAANNVFINIDAAEPGDLFIRKIIENMLKRNEMVWREPEERKPDITTLFRIKAMDDIDRLPQRLAFFKNQLRMGYPGMEPAEFDKAFDIKITGRTIEIACKQPEPDITHLQRVIAQQAQKVKLGALEVTGPF
ncbi:MAG TPA: hypothetical protein PLO23_01595 [Alphaproteobacteria bacterium]|nr:hypothetical protein [Alphaproteobacteria bacterium]